MFQHKGLDLASAVHLKICNRPVALTRRVFQIHGYMLKTSCFLGQSEMKGLAVIEAFESVCLLARPRELEPG